MLCGKYFAANVQSTGRSCCWCFDRPDQPLSQLMWQNMCDISDDVQKSVPLTWEFLHFLMMQIMPSHEENLTNILNFSLCLFQSRQAQCGNEKKKKFRGKNLWPSSDGCFSMIWGMPWTCFFLPLLILESSKWSAHSGAFYTPPESHRSLLSQDVSGESDSMWILYFLMPWSWGMRTKDQTWLTLGCKSGCNSTEWDPALGGAPLERALPSYNLMDGLFSSIKGLTHHMTALNMVRQASSLMCLLRVSTL